MAKVNNFNFGSIVIDGKQYAHDVVVLPDGTVKEKGSQLFGQNPFHLNEKDCLTADLIAQWHSGRRSPSYFLMPKYSRAVQRGLPTG